MNIRALQLGRTDYFGKYAVCPDASWNYEPQLTPEDQEYDIALIDRVLTDEEADILGKIVRAYCLFVVKGVTLTPAMKTMMEKRRGCMLPKKKLPKFFEELENYYASPYGEKFEPRSLTPSPDFRGTVQWNGLTEAVFEGSFGETMRQAAFWRGNIPVEKDQAIDFWLEYEKEGNVEIELQVVQFVGGSVAGIQNSWTFSEKQMKDIVTIDNRKGAGPVFVSLNAKGEGTLKIAALHDRHSRRGKGSFLPGSRRLVTSAREEAFVYMDPGDLKPPLCVYFSGYKTMEGFEGYRMMRRMGKPFLLISESRLEGGAFYLGSEEYEKLLKETIEGYMKELGFTKDQVILSGLSMGTFGAFYYGTMIRPAYIIVGKPLLSLGDMALAERTERPGGFPTSLDVLWKQYHSLDQEAADRLNARFWDKFEETDWSGSTFCAAYMIEDDYDRKAYQNLLSHVNKSGARVIGKGLHGRHNDDTTGVVRWFQRQYRRILEEGYEGEQD